MTDNQIIHIADKRNPVAELGLPVCQATPLSETAVTRFPRGNCVFCMDDVDEAFVEAYLDAMFDAARQALADGGIEKIVDAKLRWINQYDRSENPLGNKGFFIMNIAAPKKCVNNIDDGECQSCQ